MTNKTSTIIDFEKPLTAEEVNNWKIVGDNVMGGKSNGKFTINEKGNGVFEGKVSLENNGGFAMVQYHFNPISVKGISKVLLKVKGDGKRYQFRVKCKKTDFYSYVHYFSTSPSNKEDWETIELTLSKMEPKYRGRSLDIKNFDCETIAEIGILIGNKKAEGFRLEIGGVYLE